MSEDRGIGVLPDDEHNRRLVANVHPGDWRNPEPQGRYNLVVVGGGTAGLISASLAAGLGARVALVERHLLGGDCLNVGCVPSKALLHTSRLVADARRAAELGLALPADANVDFGAAMERVRRVRAEISRDDSAARYRDELGVDVYLGEARFAGADVVQVGEQELRFRKAVIATGARPAAPPIEGLASSGYLTNETLFELTERPPRLGVIGAGPIGCEMAQAFCRLGSEVTLFDASPQILPREDPDAASLLQERLRIEGIRLVLGCRIERVERRDASLLVLTSGPDDDSNAITVDHLLVAVGRAPNVAGLNLDAAAVACDPLRGVRVNEYLQTTNPSIYAAGDVCMDWKFTHAADAAAKIVVRNALFLRTQKQSFLVMPWCTYTDPEVAHVGISEREAREQGIDLETHRVPLSQVNRAVTDGDDAGFVKVHVAPGSDRILGATIVASHAGEMLSEVTLAMVGKLGLGTLLDVIHPYPTVAEGIKRAAGAWVRTRLTPSRKRALEAWMRFRR